MALISPQQVVDGTGIDASDVNNPINTIANDYNGNITNANVATGAAIAGSKISLATVSNPYKFSVYRAAAANSSNVAAVLNFDTKLFDTGSNVDIVTNIGRFTAPVAGFYYFNAGAGNSAATSTVNNIALRKNGTTILKNMALLLGATNTGTVIEVCGLVQLAANDYVEVVFVGGSGSSLLVGQGNQYFDGYFVSAT